MQVKPMIRWLLVVPLTGIASLCWVSMLASWIGHSNNPESEIIEKPLKQTLAQLPPEPPKPQEKEKLPPPRPKQEAPPEELARAAKESVREETSQDEPSFSSGAEAEPRVTPLRGARAKGAQGGSQGVTLSGARQEIERRGLDYLAEGKGLDSLPPTEGESESLESYKMFGKLSGFRYVIYSREKRKYIGELLLGSRPSIMPLDTESWGGRFSSKGRLIEHPALTAMAQEVAQSRGEGETSLYAFTPISFDSYVAGKILKALEICGVDRKDVIAFEVRFEVHESRPVAIFTSVRLVSGKVIAINDTEG